MVSFPPCKINLGLNVIRKRPDGFHDISTCFYPVPWNDVLEIVPSQEFAFKLTGIRVPGGSADNLCVRAYEMLKKDFRLGPVAIHLHKLIPVGAGLGGGSADGAYTLTTLRELFNLSITRESLLQYAAALGSDCPFFIEGKPKLGTGRGEILTDINVPLAGKFIIIVKPEVHISTAEAFASVVPKAPALDLQTALDRYTIAEWKNVLRNDFEDHVFEKYPVIDALHKKLYAYGADYASLSGSGSAVFGIFGKETDLRNEFAGVSYWSGLLS